MAEFNADDIDWLADASDIAWAVLTAARCEDIMLLAFRKAYKDTKGNKIKERFEGNKNLTFVPTMLKDIENKKVNTGIITHSFREWLQKDTMIVSRFLEHWTPGAAAETIINTLQLELNKEETVAEPEIKKARRFAASEKVNNSLLEFEKILHAESDTGRSWLLEEACRSAFPSLKECFDNLHLIGIPKKEIEENRKLINRFISIRNHVTHNLRLGRTVLKKRSVQNEYKRGYSALLKCGIIKLAYPDQVEDKVIQNYLENEENVNVLNLVKQIKEQSRGYRQMDELNKELIHKNRLLKIEVEHLKQELRQATSPEPASIRKRVVRERTDSNTSTMSVDDEEDEEELWRHQIIPRVKLSSPQPVSDDDEDIV